MAKIQAQVAAQKQESARRREQQKAVAVLAEAEVSKVRASEEAAVLVGYGRSRDLLCGPVWFWLNALNGCGVGTARGGEAVGGAY